VGSIYSAASRPMSVVVDLTTFQVVHSTPQPRAKAGSVLLTSRLVTKEFWNAWLVRSLAPIPQPTPATGVRSNLGAPPKLGAPPMNARARMQMLLGEAANIGMPTNPNDIGSMGAWIDRFQGNPAALQAEFAKLSPAARIALAVRSSRADSDQPSGGLPNHSRASLAGPHGIATCKSRASRRSKRQLVKVGRRPAAGHRRRRWSARFETGTNKTPDEA
jgi:hypothetical protein